MAKMIIVSLCLAVAFAPLCSAQCGGGVRGGSCGGGGYEEVRAVPASSSYVKTVRYESVPSTSYYREYSTPVVRESSPCRSGGCDSYTYERTVPSTSSVVREVSPCRNGGCSSYNYEKTVPATVVREDNPCRSGGCSSYTYERTVPAVREVVRSQPIVYERVVQPQVYSVPSYSSGCASGRCGGYSSRTVEYSAPSYSSYSYSSPVGYSSGGCRSGGCGKKK